MEWADPPVLPSFLLPEAPTMPAPVLEVPRAQIPSYKPLVVPPSDLRPPPGVKSGEAKEKEPAKPAPKFVPPQPKIELPPEAQIVQIPFTDIEVPLPTTTIMTTAATTATISVAATPNCNVFVQISSDGNETHPQNYMDQDNNKEGTKSFLDKVKENTEDELQILGTFVRLGVVVWSGFIITLNYVDLPMIKKGQSGGDITFVASVFTGALATFGLTTSNNKTNPKPPEPKKKEE